jgi:hypothetical protein
VEHPGIDGRIIIKWILMKQDGRGWTGLIWSGQGQVAGCCEHSDDSDKWQAVVNIVMIVTSGRLL